MAYIIAFSAHTYAFSLAVSPDERMSNATTEAPTTSSSIQDRGASLYNVRREGGSRNAAFAAFADKQYRYSIDFADKEGEGLKNPKFSGRHIWKPIRPKNESDLQLAMIISSYVSCSLISLGTIIWVVFDSVVQCNIPTPMPLVAKIVAPFCLSSSVRALIDSSAEESDDFAGSAKIVTSYFWIYLIAFMLLLHLIETCLHVFPVLSYCDSFCEFLTR